VSSWINFFRPWGCMGIKSIVLLYVTLPTNHTFYERKKAPKKRE
jgi:hypothetical protein